VPILERIVNAYTPLIPALKEFTYKYPTPGSSEGIYKVIAKLRAKDVDKIYILEGEYEGYQNYAEDLGMKVIQVNLEKTNLSELEKGYWFISNPSAREGNIIPNETINKICNLGNKVILDLAYVGSTKKHEFDVSNKNIETVFLSMSKPYGVFRYRIGFTFSREPINSLYGNKWFKDPVRLLQGLKLAEEIPPGSLYNKYRPIQEEIIQDINKQFGLAIKPSDAFLLGHLDREVAEDKKELVKNFARGKGYRFCLTPYFEREESGKWFVEKFSKITRLFRIPELFSMF
ncbi:MAG: aminotransferase class I/II-fold pyridoxal phosphate-dependent enzyme, partial [Nanoarchaeota archaeon]